LDEFLRYIIVKRVTIVFNKQFSPIFAHFYITLLLKYNAQPMYTTMFWNRTVCCLFFVLVTAFGAAAQDVNPNLANQYFNNGEYEKAAVMYEALAEKEERNDFFFNRYIDCLLNLQNYEAAEKAIKKQLRRNADNPQLYLTYGTLFERQGKLEESKVQYQKAIERVAIDFVAVDRLARAFRDMNKYDFAIQTYERSAKLSGEPYRFSFNLGDLYRRKGDTKKMVEKYLDAIEHDGSRVQNIQTHLARSLSPDEYTELQGQIYARLQKQESPELIELLAWSFVQRKDYRGALRQYRALDKRLDEQGQRVYRLASDAFKAKDYDTAIAAYEYIINEKGQTNPYFFESKRLVMNMRRLKITEAYNYTTADLRTLEKEYEAFLSQYGSGKLTADIVLELADLEAIYINDLPKAIRLLDGLRQSPGLDVNVQARTKINLADYYLMNGDIWESTLLYSQVDKDFKEAEIGQEARFKNARLAYFNGDFQWSRAQFDALKASTSKLISNDAIDLSVFIMDNLNLDTTAAAVSLYSAAELLVFQNKFEDAFKKLDTLRSNFPDHSLQDDILYLEAQVHEKKRDYASAIERYEKIVEKHVEDIRADNALYAMAQIYENKLIDLEKAKNLYEKIFTDFSGSIFAVDARKRFRILRGDKVQ
jgi:tetratricopeptide (TPR) repeat protein